MAASPNGATVAPTKNGYLTLDALRGLRRLEADVVIEGVGTLRVQALTQDDVHQIQQASKQDMGLWAQHEVVRGLIEPNLPALAADDVDEALAYVRAMHPMIFQTIRDKINALSFGQPSDLYLSFANGGASNDGSEAIPSGSSSSANDSM